MPLTIHSPTMPLAARHRVLGQPMTPPFPPGTNFLLFGMGCFWGAERRFWEMPRMITTAVGYAGGQLANATYEQVCSGRSGHAEVVLAVYEGSSDTLAEVLANFWESHDPTQGMRQGNDRGSQYRSTIFVDDENQLAAAEASRIEFQNKLKLAGFGTITTEIAASADFYYADDYHQQYLAKNPAGYCGLSGTGVCLAS
jgi:peptide-methionine (S)-S-oxide reductase